MFSSNPSTLFVAKKRSSCGTEANRTRCPDVISGVCCVHVPATNLYNAPGFSIGLGLALSLLLDEDDGDIELLCDKDGEVDEEGLIEALGLADAEGEADALSDVAAPSTAT